MGTLHKHTAEWTPTIIVELQKAVGSQADHWSNIHADMILPRNAYLKFTLFLSVAVTFFLLGIGFFLSNRNGTWLDIGIPGVLPSFENEGSLDGLDWRERTLAEMTYIAPAARRELEKPVSLRKMKTIAIVDTRMDDPIKDDASFLTLRCPVSSCSFTMNESSEKLASFDALLFRHQFPLPVYKRPPDQVWVLFLMESPMNSPGLTEFDNRFNWTASYRLDSTIYIPYGMYRPLAKKGKRNSRRINYAAGKTKKVGWLVSNCNARNARLEYAQALQQFIDVDIFGQCGSGSCPGGDCMAILKRDYKFYLSFENSHCRDYITEKLFLNAYSNNVIPIVLGASPEDYAKVAPPNSFIHVDDFPSPKELADYLHILDKDDSLYNSYFDWRDSGELYTSYNHGFYCRLCAKLWAETKRTWVGDVEKWWRGDGVCRSLEPGGITRSTEEISLS